jgi:hypothetical protein
MADCKQPQSHFCVEHVLDIHATPSREYIIKTVKEAATEIVALNIDALWGHEDDVAEVISRHLTTHAAAQKEGT